MRGSLGLVLLAVAGCASGTPTPAGQTDASTDRQDAANPDPTPDAAPDARPDAAPDAAVLPPDACVPMQIEKLANPVFDLTPTGTGWVGVRDPAVDALPGGPFPIVTTDPAGVTPQSAPNKAWLGGASGSDVTPAKASLTDQLYQDVVFPADTTQVVVSGYYLVGTNETGTTVYDTFSLDLVETNGTPIENVLTLSNATSASTFTQFSKTIAANLAGRTVRLRATSINDDILHTNFFLDSFSVKATHCP